MRRLTSVVLAMVLGVQWIQAEDRLHIMVAVDLSKTEEVLGYSGKSEFGQSIEAVSTILANVPPASRLTIVGITHRSYVNPLVLLEARTAPDPGAFSGRLISARRILISHWRKQAQSLKPTFNETDLLGAFLYAGDVFGRSQAQRKVLAIFSDGRNCTAELDLESPRLIDVEKSLKEIEKKQLFATLTGVEAFFFGGGDHSGKRGTAYAAGLKAFWAEYVRRSGGTLQVFSTTREPEALRAVTSLPTLRSEVK